MFKQSFENRGSQKGFTLIEMSIVLVIIGLIIGGILKGQEIIDTSRQKNFVAQFDSYRAAMNTFGDKFNGRPGDFPLATTRINASAVNGNGDGVIGTNHATRTAILGDTGNVAAGAAGGTVAGATAENMNYFCQLHQAALIGGGSTDCAAAATSFGNGQPLPASSYPNSGVDVVFGNYDTVNARTALWARVHRNVGAVTATSGILSARVMSQIDGRYDDGAPAGGIMRSANIGTGCPATAATSAYTATSETTDCVMMVELSQ